MGIPDTLIKTAALAPVPLMKHPIRLAVNCKISAPINNFHDSKNRSNPKPQTPKSAWNSHWFEMGLGK